MIWILVCLLIIANPVAPLEWSGCVFLEILLCLIPGSFLFSELLSLLDLVLVNHFVNTVSLIAMIWSPGVLCWTTTPSTCLDSQFLFR